MADETKQCHDCGHELPSDYIEDDQCFLCSPLTDDEQAILDSHLAAQPTS